MGSLVFYAGLLAAAAGALSILKPLAFLRIRTRRRGILVAFAGIAVAAAAALWPASVHRIGTPSTRLDAFLPAWHFNEVHAARVHAPAASAFRAIREVKAGEIRLLGPLMAVASLPRRLFGRSAPRSPVPGYEVVARDGPRREWRDVTIDLDEPRIRRIEGDVSSARYEPPAGTPPAAPETILHAYDEAIAGMGGTALWKDGAARAAYRIGPEGAAAWVEVEILEAGRAIRIDVVQEDAAADAAPRPFLEVMLRAGFVLLADEPDREVVIGEVLRASSAPEDRPARRPGTPEEFLAFDAPGWVKVAVTFRVEAEDGGWSRVTTETRILAADPSAARGFGIYWRVIHPGSALIRRSWLAAIRRRAESST